MKSQIKIFLFITLDMYGCLFVAKIYFYIQWKYMYMQWKIFGIYKNILYSIIFVINKKYLYLMKNIWYLRKYICIQ